MRALDIIMDLILVCVWHTPGSGRFLHKYMQPIPFRSDGDRREAQQGQEGEED